MWLFWVWASGQPGNKQVAFLQQNGARMPTKIHLKPERAWKGILYTKKKNNFFLDGFFLLAACCSSFKRGLPDSAVRKEKKNHAVWNGSFLGCAASRNSDSFRRSGYGAFKWGLWTESYNLLKGITGLWQPDPRSRAVRMALRGNEWTPDMLNWAETKAKQP